LIFAANPAALWGLALLAVPVLIHLLRLQRLVRMQFSQLSFLAPISQASDRLSNLRRLLLLVARLLLVLAIVLLFADIHWRPSGGPPQAAEAIVIVVDESPSMGVATSRGLPLGRAKAAAKMIVAAHPGAKFRVVPWSVQADTDADIEAILPTSYAGPSLAGVIRKSKGWFDGMVGTTRTLYVVSDFQASTVLIDTLSSGLAYVGRLVLVQIGEGSTGTPFVSNSTVEGLSGEAEGSFLIGTVENPSMSIARQVPLRLVVDGVPTAAQSVDIPARGKQAFRMRLPGTLGPHSGMLTVGNEINRGASRSFLSYTAKPAGRVLVISNLPAPAAILAFERATAGQAKLTYISPAEFSRIDLAGFEVVLALAPLATAGDRSRLVTWVKAGGGCILFPSARSADTQSWQDICQRLEIGELEAGPTPPLAINASFQFDHPELARMLAKAPLPGQAAVVKLSEAVRFRPRPGIARSVLLATNGISQAPVITGVSSGRGLVYMCTAGLALEASELSLHPVFAPLLLHMIVAAGQGQLLPLSYSLAERIEIRIATRAGGLITLIKPDGSKLQTVASDLTPEGQSVSISGEGIAPGVYQLTGEGMPLHTIALSTLAAELNRSSPSQAELRERLIEIGIVGAEIWPGEQLTEGGLRSQAEGQSWQVWLLGACLALIAAEIVILEWIRSAQMTSSLTHE
jgi:hypothetical protein